VRASGDGAGAGAAQNPLAGGARLACRQREEQVQLKRVVWVCQVVHAAVAAEPHSVLFADRGQRGPHTAVTGGTGRFPYDQHVDLAGFQSIRERLPARAALLRVFRGADVVVAPDTERLPPFALDPRRALALLFLHRPGIASTVLTDSRVDRRPHAAHNNPL